MIKLPAIFKNNAVFQRDKAFRVWGNSDSDNIGIEIFDESGITVNKGHAEVKDNSFKIELSPNEAGGPFIIEIYECDNEGNKLTPDKASEIVLSDVYFGDVWLAGGQSNMEFLLKNSKSYAEELEELNDDISDRIRYYNVPQIAWLGEELAEAEAESKWQKCNGASIGDWSAVAYYFAKALTEESEGIMIGIINCSWGGTSASAWIGREKLLEHKETAQYVDAYDKATEGMSEADYLKAYDEYVIYQAEFDKNVGNYYQTCDNPSWDEAIALFGENKYPGPMGPKNWTRPSGLYETMLKRVAPYSLMGCIYYQGEEDDNRPYSYKRLLTSLIEQWRKDFEDEMLPFITAQLPIFVNEGEDDYKNWPFIREAQMQVGESIGNGTAVILEAGEYHNIHPLNKETVGYRLAFQALYKVYGCLTRWEACGPEYDSSFVSDNAMYIDLKCCESGLILDGDDGFIQDVHMMDFLPGDSGFELAGVDGVYYAAKAQVMRGENVGGEEENDQSASMTGSIMTIKLTSDNVTVPKYARYFWKNYGKVRVFGANGIPLAPFRTDMNDGAKALGSRLGEIIDAI